MRTYDQIREEFNKWCQEEDMAYNNNTTKFEMAMIVQWSRLTRVPFCDIETMIKRHGSGWVYNDLVNLRDERLRELMEMWREP